MVIFETVQDYLGLNKVVVKNQTADTPWPWGLTKGVAPQIELVMLDYTEVDPHAAYNLALDIPQDSKGYFESFDDIESYVSINPNTTIPLAFQPVA